MRGSSAAEISICYKISSSESWAIMVAPFDILRVLKDGAPLWMEAAQTLEEAKTRVRQLAAIQPGSYVIFSQKTGNKIVITADGKGSATSLQGSAEASSQKPLD